MAQASHIWISSTVSAMLATTSTASSPLACPSASVWTSYSSLLRCAACAPMIHFAASWSRKRTFALTTLWPLSSAPIRTLRSLPLSRPRTQRPLYAASSVVFLATWRRTEGPVPTQTRSTTLSLNAPVIAPTRPSRSLSSKEAPLRHPLLHPCPCPHPCHLPPLLASLQG